YHHEEGCDDESAPRLLGHSRDGAGAGGLGRRRGDDEAFGLDLLHRRRPDDVRPCRSRALASTQWRHRRHVPDDHGDARDAIRDRRSRRRCCRDVRRRILRDTARARRPLSERLRHDRLPSRGHTPDRLEDHGDGAIARDRDGHGDMAMIKRALVPVETAAAAEDVLSVVDTLATAGTAVRLGHVAPMQDNVVTVNGRLVTYADQEMASIEAQWSDTFDATFARLQAGSVDHVVRFGDPVNEILAEAEAFGADTIVVTSGTRSSVKRVLLGSVAEATLRRARVGVRRYPPPRGRLRLGAS